MVRSSGLLNVLWGALLRLARCVRAYAAAALSWATYRVEIHRIQSLSDLRTSCNHSTIGEDGNLEFLYSTFTFVSKDYAVYFGQTSIRKLTPEVVNESLRQVPDEDVYPEAPLHIKSVAKADSRFFIKGPALTFYDELGGSGMIAKVLLQEAETLEILERNPHPNIIRYHGCLVHRGRIVGLVLERYICNLQERMRDDGHDLDLDSLLDGIKSGVEHLHSLGRAHNDITPDNIMLSADNTWILVDVGSCRPFGEDLIIAGNREWKTSSKQHDEDALKNLSIWLTDRKPAVT